MKSLKMMGLGPRKSKSGFTLIELLIVMVIIAILAGVIVLAVSGVFKTTGQAAYTTVSGEIAPALTGYASNSSHLGQFPTLTGTVNVSGTNYNIIDMNQLLTVNGGIMNNMPTGLYSSGVAGQDNCNGSTTGTNTCSSKYHYIWAVDSLGDLYSVCIGCTGATNTTGFQGSW